MAANTSVKVATITGAAKDDAFTSAGTGLTEDLTSARLNVLANDPGAARLYSLAQSTAGLTSTSQFPVVTTAVLASGATITINTDGTISYNASAIQSSLQQYAQGETFTDSFVYTVRMANGALSTARVTVQVAGANDAPTLAAIEPVSILDTSADDTPAAISGTLGGADVDRGAVLTYSFAEGVTFSAAADGSLVSSNNYGTISLNPQTGSYSFVANADVIDSLALGESENAAFGVQVTDEHGAKSATVPLTFTLIGANDGPTLATVEPVAIFDSAADDTPSAVTGTLVGADVDNGAVLTYGFADGVVFSVASDGSLVSTNAYGTISLNAQTGAYNFVADADAIDALAAGVNASASFGVQVADEHGAKAQVTLAFNLVGANDTAEISGNAGGSVAEDGNGSASGTLSVSDRDAGQSGFLAPDQLGGVYGDFTFNAASGAWTYTLRNGDANVQALSASDTVYDELVISSLDGSATETLRVSIAGANEPVVLPPVPQPDPQPDTPPAQEPVNPVTRYMVNHGLSFVNNRATFTGFDANDKLVYSNNFDLTGIATADVNSDAILDTVVSFEFTRGRDTTYVEVVLLGYSPLTGDQISLE